MLMKFKVLPVNKSQTNRMTNKDLDRMGKED